MIKIENISKTFINGKSSIVALDGISISVKQGEIISIVGKSGSGKSTLLNILLGILKPTSGTIKIDDILITSKTKKKILRKITKIELSSFQYPDHQLFNQTVKKEMLYNSTDEKYMYELMDIIDFSKELLDRTPFSLSSGQKRKLILISLLIQKPKILLLDEPTAFLDAKSRVEFLKIILEINKKYNTTIVFISHNIEDVKRLNGRTFHIDKGKIINKGKAIDILKNFGGEYE